MSKDFGWNRPQDANVKGDRPQLRNIWPEVNGKQKGYKALVVLRLPQQSICMDRKEHETRVCHVDTLVYATFPQPRQVESEAQLADDPSCTTFCESPLRESWTKKTNIFHKAHVNAT